MSFFKKIKNKLFSLNDNDNQSQNTKIEKQNKTQETSNKFILQKEKAKIFKLQEKLDKKETKLRYKTLSKENKINKYVSGLRKSGNNFSQKIIELQNKHNKIDDDFFEELEEILIMSDISVNLVLIIIDEIKKEVKTENVVDRNLINEIIADKMFAIYANQSIVDTTLNLDNDGLNVLLVVGVNGSGKTTSIAKIANKLINDGKSVLIGAGDTFRAGAVAQLKVWANKVGAEIVMSEKEGADPSSVIYKSLEIAINKKYDVLIIDTAGRLQNKVNLMNELAKMNGIIKKFIPDAPHETLLVLDATTGQNGVLQAKSFQEVAPLTGIILTKMDGTSNGGIILSIKDQLNIDVKLIGLGEKIDDLQEFDLDAYIYGLSKGLMINE